MLSSGLRKVMKALLISACGRLDHDESLLRASVRRASPTTAFVSTYLDAAVRPATDDAFALVFPEVNANPMDVFLNRFAACRAQNTHAIVLLDQAGRHVEKTFRGAGGRSQHQKRVYSSSSSVA